MDMKIVYGLPRPKKDIKMKDTTVPEWKMSIYKTKNGFMVTTTEEGAPVESHVIQEQNNPEDDNNLRNAEMLQELLYLIQNHFAMTFSKHSKYIGKFIIEEQQKKKKNDMVL